MIGAERKKKTASVQALTQFVYELAVSINGGITLIYGPIVNWLD